MIVCYSDCLMMLMLLILNRVLHCGHGVDMSRCRVHWIVWYCYYFACLFQDEVKSALFEWTDGIVVQAMTSGSCVLIDEISLAEDAVLERLNSVLEPERTLLVAERSRHGGDVYEIVAQDGFMFMATMNPGGDYGKKEVSDVLQSRFLYKELVSLKKNQIN